MVDNQKEQILKSQNTAGSVVVDDLPRDKPMILDEMTEQADSLSHHLDEPLPPPANNNNSDQLVDYFENPDLETEQSLLSAVDNNTTTTTTAAATSVVEDKDESPVPGLETEQSLLSAVDNITTSPVTDIENKNFTNETNNLISSIDDKVIEEIIAKEVLLEHRGDELTHEKTENEDLNNEEFVHVEDNEFATEIEKGSKSDLFGFVEEHYSKEVVIHLSSVLSSNCWLTSISKCPPIVMLS